ncbi:hypothetical protein RCL_jg22938.t1 [Rhizophagus clarus]|uniref:Uncharacterized protein n=1 Tax=Rhizophagus clarus TaxID=94130 RepID=A0A8H3L1Y0_9GLOM|nr:hypothetical protein RCL_jg22938.t1 [Rhizophagus clarus]
MFIFLIVKSGTPLEADYDILKIQMFHFKDWTLFEDLVTIFEDYFEGPDKARTPFKGQRSGLSGMLQNFEGLRLLDEDFKSLQFSLGAIIFSRFDAFC